MDDALFMSSFQTLGDLAADFQSLINRRGPLAIFCANVSLSTISSTGSACHLLVLPVYGRNVGMIERCQELGFTLESGKPFGIFGEIVRRNLRATLRSSDVS